MTLPAKSCWLMPSPSASGNKGFKAVCEVDLTIIEPPHRHRPLQVPIKVSFILGTSDALTFAD